MQVFGCTILFFPFFFQTEDGELLSFEDEKFVFNSNKKFCVLTLYRIYKEDRDID